MEKKLIDNMYTINELKHQAAEAVIDLIRKTYMSPILIGVGSGSTVEIFINHISKIKNCLIGAVPTSKRTASALEKSGIPIIDLPNQSQPLELYIDSADEIDPSLKMIKGGGGALTFEKIVAFFSKKFICIIDESKEVSHLGNFPLAIEVLPIALSGTKNALKQMGGVPTLRKNFITESHNIIVDVTGLNFHEPIILEQKINNVPGVVCSGLFAIQSANLAIIATQHGVKTIHFNSN